MPSLPTLKRQWTDNVGAILAAGKVNFYTAGTSNRLDTYPSAADVAADTNANANPVVLDGNGRDAGIYLKTDANYKVVLTDSADVEIFTLDTVEAGELANADAQARIDQISSNPLDQGAAGDGSTDDATALAAAFAAATGVVDLLGKTYRCDSILTMTSGLTVRNGTIDFSNASIAAGIKAAGSAGTSSVVSTATVATQTITPASTAGYATGDILRLRSDDVMSASHKFAELFRVEQISGSDILVDGNILGTYTTNPLVEEITTVKNITLENVTIIAPNGGEAIDFDMCENVVLRDCTFKGTGTGENTRITNTYGIQIDGCRWTHKTTSSGPGLHITDASRDVMVRGCTFERCNAPLLIGNVITLLDGITRDVIITGNRFIWSGQIHISNGAWFVLMDSNSIDFDVGVANTHVRLGGRNMIFRGNALRDSRASTTDQAIIVTALGGDYCKIEGNAITGCKEGIHVSSVTCSLVRIHGNEIEGATDEYVLVDSTCTISALEITGNRFLDGTGTGVAIDITPTGSTGLIRCSDNHLDMGSSYTVGIDLGGGSITGLRAYVEGNDILGTAAASTGILATDTGFTQRRISRNTITTAIVTSISVAGDSVRIADNDIASSANSSTGILAADGTHVRIAGNTTDMTGATSKGIAYTQSAESSATQLSISDNDVDATADGISIVTTGSDSRTENVTITGNNVKLTSSGATTYALHMKGSGTGGGAVKYATVTGNVFVRNADEGLLCFGDYLTGMTFGDNACLNGTYAMSVTNETETVNSGCVCTGQATGTFLGFGTNGDIDA